MQTGGKDSEQTSFMHTRSLISEHQQDTSASASIGNVQCVGIDLQVIYN